jgi:hypothetical protein
MQFSLRFRDYFPLENFIELRVILFRFEEFSQKTDNIFDRFGVGNPSDFSLQLGETEGENIFKLFGSYFSDISRSEC